MIDKLNTDRTNAKNLFLFDEETVFIPFTKRDLSKVYGSLRRTSIQLEKVDVFPEKREYQAILTDLVNGLSLLMQKKTS